MATLLGVMIPLVVFRSYAHVTIVERSWEADGCSFLMPHMEAGKQQKQAESWYRPLSVARAMIAVSAALLHSGWARGFP